MSGVLDELGEPDPQAHFEHEAQKRDIETMMVVFEIQKKSSYKTDAEYDAFRAQREINEAQGKLRELQLQVEKQEATIREAEKKFAKCKRQLNAEKQAKGVGRPAVLEEHKLIAKYFVTQWVKAVMEALETNSCKQLELVLCSDKTRCTERNWRRWLKGEAIPTYKTFLSLLSARVQRGRHAGKLLQDMPTTPGSNQLATILRFL